jgi:hypothetical protein
MEAFCIAYTYRVGSRTKRTRVIVTAENYEEAKEILRKSERFTTINIEEPATIIPSGEIWFLDETIL